MSLNIHYAPTPNGWKVAIMLEETGLPYELKPVSLHDGNQFAPDFLAISPNAKMPAILDHASADGYGDAPLPVSNPPPSSSTSPRRPDASRRPKRAAGRARS